MNRYFDLTDPERFRRFPQGFPGRHSDIGDQVRAGCQQSTQIGPVFSSFGPFIAQRQEPRVLDDNPLDALRPERVEGEFDIDPIFAANHLIFPSLA